MNVPPLVSYANSGEGDYDPGGVPRPGFAGRILLCITGTWIVVCILWQLVQALICWCRLRGHRRVSLYHAYFAVWSTVQEIGQWRYRVPGFGRRKVGSTLIVSAYILALMILQFVRLPVRQTNLEKLAFRSAWLSVYQLPLLVLVATKRSPLGWMLAMSAEELNVYHRWVSRGLFVTASLHFVFMWRYYDLVNLLGDKWNQGGKFQSGIVAWTVLCWTTLSSFGPVRLRLIGRRFFFLQHVISIVAFLWAMLRHAPEYARVLCYISIGLIAADWAARLVHVVFINRGLVTTGTILRSSPSHFVLTISNPNMSWRPGQHVRVSFPFLGAFSHPFTPFTVDESEQLKINVRIRSSGITARLATKTQVRLILEGPFGYPRDLRQYHTVLLVSAGAGLFKSLALAQGIVESDTRLCPMKRVRVICFVRTRSALDPYQAELDALGGGHLELAIDVYCTGGSGGKKPPRPDMYSLLYMDISACPGQSAVSVCGPDEFVSCVGNTVLRITDDRACHRGTSAHGVYLC